jgi:hypothetical protein
VSLEHTPAPCATTELNWTTLHCCLLLPSVEAKVNSRYTNYSYLLVLYFCSYLYLY